LPNMQRVSPNNTTTPIQRARIEQLASSVVVGCKVKHKIPRAVAREKPRIVAPKPGLAVREQGPYTGRDDIHARTGRITA
jgi:hypothetical protein